MLGGRCLCLTSFLLLFDFLGSSLATGLHTFSEESYIDVSIMGIDAWGWLFSIELLLEDLKLGIGMDISLKSLTASSQYSWMSNVPSPESKE